MLGRVYKYKKPVFQKQNVTNETLNQEKEGICNQTSWSSFWNSGLPWPVKLPFFLLAQPTYSGSKYTDLKQTLISGSLSVFTCFHSDLIHHHCPAEILSLITVVHNLGGMPPRVAQEVLWAGGGRQRNWDPTDPAGPAAIIAGAGFKKKVLYCALHISYH